MQTNDDRGTCECLGREHKMLCDHEPGECPRLSGGGKRVKYCQLCDHEAEAMYERETAKFNAEREKQQRREEAEWARQATERRRIEEAEWAARRASVRAVKSVGVGIEPAHAAVERVRCRIERLFTEIDRAMASRRKIKAKILQSVGASQCGWVKRADLTRHLKNLHIAGEQVDHLVEELVSEKALDTHYISGIAGVKLQWRPYWAIGLPQHIQRMRADEERIAIEDTDRSKTTDPDPCLFASPAATRRSTATPQSSPGDEFAIVKCHDCGREDARWQMVNHDDECPAPRM